MSARPLSARPELAVLVATDTAGEGLNLQRAHLMVSYDLPWRPQPHRATVRSASTPHQTGGGLSPVEPRGCRHS
ncbi:SWF/SNF helicase family protein [Pseudonocardia sp. MCCB 268]|nr:SWF/SNF helicase family protein [Pseudonocardia cytotoxica]